MASLCSIRWTALIRTKGAEAAGRLGFPRGRHQSPSGDYRAKRKLSTRSGQDISLQSGQDISLRSPFGLN